MYKVQRIALLFFAACLTDITGNYQSVFITVYAARGFAPSLSNQQRGNQSNHEYQFFFQ